jgi:hypothetical protein
MDPGVLYSFRKENAMQNQTKIAMIRGAGLSFPLAALLFLFVGKLYVFSFILVGALIGFGVGEWISRGSVFHRNSQLAVISDHREVGQPGWLVNHLLHPNLLIRLAALLVLGSGLLLATWSIGYYLLPEGVFHGGAEAQMARGTLNTPSANGVEEWGKIFRANLVPVALILIGSLLIRVNGISFGCLVSLVNIIGYGLFMGTNSFAIPMPVRLAPSLEILQRSGPYEMLALVLLAASSYSWSFFEVKQLFRTNPSQVQPRPKIIGSEVGVFLLGIVILAAANWMEASMVMTTYFR